VAVRFWPKILADLLYEISAQLAVLLYFGPRSAEKSCFFLQDSKFHFWTAAGAFWTVTPGSGRAPTVLKTRLNAHQTSPKHVLAQKIFRALRDLLYV
jgi:hypothetical protein